MQVAQGGDLVRTEAQGIDCCVPRLALNPCGDTGGFGGGDARFVAAKGLIDDVVLQADDAVLEEEAVFGGFTSSQVELSLEKCCFDGVVQGCGTRFLML